MFGAAIGAPPVVSQADRICGHGFILKTLSTITLIIISILWLDRPLSTLAHAHTAGMIPLGFTANYRGTAIEVTLATLLVSPAQVVSMLYLPATILLGAILYRRRRLPGIAQVILRASLATAAALEIKERLKWVFGRTWPESWTGWNVSWIRDGAYGFHYFHSGTEYSAFPSGHTVAIIAFVIPFWRAYPACRPFALLTCIAVALGLVAGNYHFLSDVVAGAYLGIVVGAFCDTLLRSVTFNDPRPARGD